MKKWMKNIIIILTVVVFVVSVNGVLLIDHTCYSCKTEEMSLFFHDHHQHNCCHEDHTVIESCCSHHPVIHEGEETGCCNDDAVFIKVKSPYLFSNNQIVDMVKIMTLSFVIPDYLFSELIYSSNYLIADIKDSFPESGQIFYCFCQLLL